MAHVLGRWVEPTITGDRRIMVDGTSFDVPEGATVKVVNASGRRQFAHVRHGGRVVVLCRYGQLLETDAEARARARVNNWNLVPK